MVKAPEKYVARICWNSANWVHPTGEAPSIERATYVTEAGFGLEEWLFNFQWVLDGWEYGFLQPVNRSLAKAQGTTIDIRLCAISPKAEWFYVAHVPRCEVLTEEQAEYARREFKRRGWFQDMVDQVRAVRGKARELSVARPTLLFNLRFRPKAVSIYGPMRRVGARDPTRSCRRFVLVGLRGTRRRVERDWQTRVGTTELPGPGRRSRHAVMPVVMNMVEHQLQKELLRLLAKRYGKGAVVAEEGFADLKIRHARKLTIVEIKSDPRPRFAIREALGQLLEYAFIGERSGESLADLVVAGPGEITDPDHAYVKHLRKRWGLPVRFVCIRRGATSVDI